MNLNIVRDNTEEFKDFNSNQLHHFNRNNCEYIKDNSSEQHSHKIPFGFKVLDQDKYIGGLTGVIRYGWCFVDILMIEDGYRKAGIGSKLIEQVEKFALENNALGIRLWTWNFQAKEFYEKLGYVCYAEFKDCPPGTTEYHFMKSLTYLKPQRY